MTIKELLGEAYKDGMTIVEVEAALSGKNLADLSSGEYVSLSKFKDAEKKAKEMSDQLKEKMTAEEKSAIEKAEREQYVKDLEKKVKLFDYKAKLSQTIKDDETLNKLAEAYADGNLEKAFELQNIYLVKEKEDIEKRVKTELMQQNPQPTPDGNTKNKKKTLADYATSPNGFDELDKLRKENPKLYKEILNGDGE